MTKLLPLFSHLRLRQLSLFLFSSSLLSFSKIILVLWHRLTDVSGLLARAKFNVRSEARRLDGIPFGLMRCVSMPAQS